MTNAMPYGVTFSFYFDVFVIEDYILSVLTRIASSRFCLPSKEHTQAHINPYQSTHAPTDAHRRTRTHIYAHMFLIDKRFHVDLIETRRAKLPPDMLAFVAFFGQQLHYALRKNLTQYNSDSLWLFFQLFSSLILVLHNFCFVLHYPL